MPYDSFQDRVNLWFLWTIASAVGCAIGWTVGETVGQMAHHMFGWTVGHVVGWSMYELSVWLMRWQVLRRVSTIPVWRRLDVWIWFCAELFAWSIGEGFHRLAPTVWVTVSAVWGTGFGAIIWFLFACMRQAKASRWFILAGTAYGLLGFIVSVFMFTSIMVLADEVVRRAATMAVPAIGWAIGGVILGAGTGGMNGIAVARLWFVPGKPTV